MLVLPVTTYMIIIKNIFLVSSEYTVDLRHIKFLYNLVKSIFWNQLSLNFILDIYLLQPHSRKWKRWPSHYLWKKAWYLPYWQYTTLKIPWSYHQLPHKRQHLQVTNLPYLFISSSNSLHEHWLGKTTDCWLGGEGRVKGEGFKLSLLSAIWDCSQQHSLKDNKFTCSHQIKKEKVREEYKRCNIGIGHRNPTAYDA